MGSGRVPASSGSQEPGGRGATRGARGGGAEQGRAGDGGEGVDTVGPGNFVILDWRAVCGRCRACKRGELWYCFDTHNAAQPMSLTDGSSGFPLGT